MFPFSSQLIKLKMRVSRHEKYREWCGESMVLVLAGICSFVLIPSCCNKLVAILFEPMRFENYRRRGWMITSNPLQCGLTCVWRPFGKERREKMRLMRKPTVSLPWFVLCVVGILRASFTPLPISQVIYPSVACIFPCLHTMVFARTNSFSWKIISLTNVFLL